MKYRKKPVIIEAYQTDKEIIIHTLEGDMKASVGDYIITGINGEQYPCKPDIFEKTYESVKEETNYNRIKNMNIDEMSEFFSSNEYPDFPHSPCYICEYDKGMTCGKLTGCNSEQKLKVYKEWLEKEVQC